MPEKDGTAKVETHFIIHSTKISKDDSWVIRFSI